MKRTTLLALIALFVGGCNATAESPRETAAVVEPEGVMTLHGAREQWRGAALEAYRYRLRKQCFCPKDVLVPVEVTVSGGEVAELRSVASASQVPQGIRDSARTIPGWFDYIEAWQKESPARLEVEYDHDTGAPVRIHIDRHERMSDDEITWHISDLQSTSVE